MPDPTWSERLAWHAMDLDEDGHDVGQAGKWKQPVRVATTASGTLATAYEDGDTVDGVVLAPGDRVLLKDQSTGSQNGIYTVNPTGAPTRATDFDDGSDVPGAVVYVIAGTANGGKSFRATNTTEPTIDTTTISFAEFGVGDHGALTGLSDFDHDQYVRGTHGGRETFQSHGNTGSTETIDLANGNYHAATLNADCTFTFTGATTGKLVSFTLELLEDGTGGWDPTWPASVVWIGGDAPVHDTTADSTTFYVFHTRDNGTTWFGAQVGSGSLDAEGVRDAGRWEIVMEVGVTAPPVPVTNEAQDDWLYAWVTD